MCSNASATQRASLVPQVIANDADLGVSRDHVVLDLQREIESRTRWVQDIKRELELRDQTIRQLQEAFDERTRWALELRDLVEKREAELEELRGKGPQPVDIRPAGEGTHE
jgi:hypothetical protein